MNIQTIRWEKRMSMFLPYFVIFIASCIAIFPFIWTFIAATHTNTQIFQLSQTFIPGKNFINNYHDLADFSCIWRNLFNSVFIACMYTILVCCIDSMAGYAFAKFQFKGRDVIFFICLCSMFVPQQVTMVPLFIQLSSIKLINSPWAVILPSLTSVFGVFLMRQNFFSFPDELIESARIDGAGDFKIFLRIVIPTMTSTFAILGILAFVQSWGNYLWPLIVLNIKKSFTLPLVLALMRAGANVINYGAIMVGAVLALIPVLIIFLFSQKNIISGVLSGAIKG